MGKRLEGREIVVKCHRCHFMTLELIRKRWQKKPLRPLKELIGSYKCGKCGFTHSRVFATERV